MKSIESNGGARSWRSTGPWLCCPRLSFWCSFFMSSRREAKMVVLLLLLYGVPRMCEWCSRLDADLLFSTAAYFGSRRSLSHSLREPPITRLPTLLSLPCASAAVPISRCSGSSFGISLPCLLAATVLLLWSLQSFCYRKCLSDPKI